MTNLLGNAFKFGARKPVHVTVATERAGASLVVRDHGPGIAEQDRERIFQRYERAISGTRYGGLGLGLYIVRQIVEAHGGTIRVESELGNGSAFAVVLPREAARRLETALPSSGSAGRGNAEREVRFGQARSDRRG